MQTNSIVELGDFRDATAPAPWRHNRMSESDFLGCIWHRETHLRPFSFLGVTVDMAMVDPSAMRNSSNFSDMSSCNAVCFLHQMGDRLASTEASLASLLSTEHVVELESKLDALQKCLDHAHD